MSRLPNGGGLQGGVPLRRDDVIIGGFESPYIHGQLTEDEVLQWINHPARVIGSGHLKVIFEKAQQAGHYRVAAAIAQRRARIAPGDDSALYNVAFRVGDLRLAQILEAAGLEPYAADVGDLPIDEHPDLIAWYLTGMMPIGRAAEVPANWLITLGRRADFYGAQTQVQMILERREEMTPALWDLLLMVTIWPRRTDNSRAIQRRTALAAMMGEALPTNLVRYVVGRL